MKISTMLKCTRYNSREVEMRAGNARPRNAIPAGRCIKIYQAKVQKTLSLGRVRSSCGIKRLASINYVSKWVRKIHGQFCRADIAYVAPTV